MVKERTGGDMTDAPVVYLEKNSHLLFDLTPRTDGAACDSYGVVNECKSACRSNSKLPI